MLEEQKDLEVTSQYNIIIKISFPKDKLSKQLK